MTTGPEMDGDRYRISRSGIGDLWGLVQDETRLTEAERVFLTLVLTELDQRRASEEVCR